MRRSVIVAAVVVALFAGATACTSDNGLRRTAGGTGGTASGAGGSGAVGGGSGGTLATGGTGGIGAGGGGGTVGTGGTGGGQSGKNEPIPLSPEQEWLVDRDIWKPLPGEWTEHCRGYVADKEDLQFPKLAWESCGNACEKADLVQGFGWHAGAASLSTTLNAKGEVPLFRFVLPGLGDERTLHSLHRILRMDTGDTLAAVRFSRVRDAEYSPCSPAVYGGAGRLVWGLGDTRPARDVDGVFDIRTEAWTWNLPWFAAREAFPEHEYSTWLGMEDGRTILPGVGKVYAQLTPGSSEVTLLDDIGADREGERGGSQGNLAAWPEVEARVHATRIRGWTPERGVHTILPSVSGDTCHVAVSDSHLAGISFEGTGERDCWKAMNNPRFWVLPRESEGAEDEGLNRSPFLNREMAYNSLRLATWGSRVVVVLSEPVHIHDRKTWIVVSSFPAWNMKWMEIPEGLGVQTVSLTSTHLYVVLGKLGADVGKVYEVHRYDLSRIEDFTVER